MMLIEQIYFISVDLIGFCLNDEMFIRVTTYYEYQI